MVSLGNVTFATNESGKTEAVLPANPFIPLGQRASWPLAVASPAFPQDLLQRIPPNFSACRRTYSPNLPEPQKPHEINDCLDSLFNTQENVGSNSQQFEVRVNKI